MLLRAPRRKAIVAFLSLALLGGIGTSSSSTPATATETDCLDPAGLLFCVEATVTASTVCELRAGNEAWCINEAAWTVEGRGVAPGEVAWFAMGLLTGCPPNAGGLCEAHLSTNPLGTCQVFLSPCGVSTTTVVDFGRAIRLDPGTCMTFTSETVALVQGYPLDEDLWGEPPPTHVAPQASTAATVCA